MALDAVDLRQDALAGLARELEGGASEALRIEAVGFRSVINLRARHDNGFAAAIKDAVGVDLPLEANHWTGDERRAVIWLGPDEWLLVAPDGDAASIEGAIRDACSGDPWLSVVDVSHSYSTLLVSGPQAGEVLAKGCALDLDARVFGPGDCAQTMLAKSRVLLRALDDSPSIEVWVRNSYAQYTVRWLLDASEEFRERPARQAQETFLSKPFAGKIVLIP